MDSTEKTNSKNKDCLTPIIITECITALVILLSVLVIKYFFKPCYSELKAYYENYICDSTSVSEVLETVGEKLEI